VKKGKGSPMDAAKAKELKKYTRELLRDHETLSRNLAAAEALAAERQAELDKLHGFAHRPLRWQHPRRGRLLR
jgi:hypothetical protein